MITSSCYKYDFVSHNFSFSSNNYTQVCHHFKCFFFLVWQKWASTVHYMRLLFVNMKRKIAKNKNGNVNTSGFRVHYSFIFICIQLAHYLHTASFSLLLVNVLSTKELHSPVICYTQIPTPNHKSHFLSEPEQKHSVYFSLLNITHQAVCEHE